MIAAILIAVALIISFPPSVSASESSQQNLLSPLGMCPGEQISSTKKKAAAVRAMICHLHFARKKAQKPRLTVNQNLERSASAKAGDILRCKSFSHTACKRPFDFWIKKYFVRNQRCWQAAENIAWGIDNLGTSRSIFRALLLSKPHRKALLDRQYQEVGIGLRAGKLRGFPNANVWVMHLGTTC